MDIPIVLSLLTLLRQSRGHDRWTPEKLAQHQAHALAKLRLHAYTHSPFYRRFHEDGYESPLHDLPVLTKKMLMANFDEVVTDPRIHLDSVKAHVANASADALYLGRYWVNATSGSTGNPGLFLFNHREWATVLLSFIRGYEWAGIIVNLLHRRKVALVASRNVSHMSAQVGFTLESPWASTTHISAMEPLTSIVERLNEAQPEILVAYASMARLLAVEQLEKRLHITPKVIFASAEVVTEETRRMVNDAWGDCLYNEYAATETAGIAAECQQHHLHLFEDSVIVENVDEHYQPVPTGEYGAKLLVTVLFNFTQPLIRYELSDSVRLSDEVCACGRPFRVLEGIQGRVEDILYMPDAEGQKVPVHPHIFHAAMDTVSVGGWQVAYRADGLHVQLSGTPPDFDAAPLESTLRRALEKQHIIMPPLMIECVDIIPRASSGKAPLIKSEVP